MERGGMSAAVSTSARSTTTQPPISRTVRLIRVAVLIVAGMVIAFSATLHEHLSFDVGVTTAALGAIGVAHLIEWLAAPAPHRTAVPLMLGIISVLAGVILPFFTGSVLVFACVIAGWALISALLEFLGSAVRPGSRQDATLVGAAGVLLALCVLLVREDQVAVLGFFGAYAILVGVFLGISAFDTRRVTETTGDEAGTAPAAR